MVGGVVIGVLATSNCRPSCSIRQHSASIRAVRQWVMKTTPLSDDRSVVDRPRRQNLISNLVSSVNCRSSVRLPMTPSRASWLSVIFSLEEVEGRRREWRGSWPFSNFRYFLWQHDITVEVWVDFFSLKFCVPCFFDAIWSSNIQKEDTKSLQTHQHRVFYISPIYL